MDAVAPDSPAAVSALRGRVVDMLHADTEGFLSDATLRRFLRARDGVLREAEKMLRAAVKWRRETLADLNAARSPAGAARVLAHTGCRFCERKRGFHPMRQVGFDRDRRPVLYAAFSQASNYWFKVADTVAHFPVVLENAAMTMDEGVDEFVWVIDFTGFGMGCCNPMQGATAIKIMQNMYPERLGLAFCINAPWAFSTFWAAISGFIDPKTRSKVKFCTTTRSFKEACAGIMSDDMTDWLLTEQELNKRSPIPQSQKEFWLAPPKAMDGTSPGHDPRGVNSFVQEYIETFSAPAASMFAYQPHPNIIQDRLERMAREAAGAAHADAGKDEVRGRYKKFARSPAPSVIPIAGTSSGRIVAIV